MRGTTLPPADHIFCSGPKSEDQSKYYWASLHFSTRCDKSNSSLTAALLLVIDQGISALAVLTNLNLNTWNRLHHKNAGSHANSFCCFLSIAVNNMDSHSHLVLPVFSQVRPHHRFGRDGALLIN